MYRKHFAEKPKTNRIANWPVGKSLLVAEMSQIVDVTEQLILQFGVVDQRNRAELVQGLKIITIRILIDNNFTKIKWRQEYRKKCERKTKNLHLP